MSDFNIDLDVQKNLVLPLGTAGLRTQAYEVAAVSRWARRAKGNGYWTKLIEVIPFVGLTKTAALYKLKWHALNTGLMAYVGSALADGLYSPRCGFLSDGTNCFNLGFVPSTMLTANDGLMVAFGVCWNGVTNPANTPIMGCLDTGKGVIHVATNGAGSAFIQGVNLVADGGGTPGISGNVISGFYVANRTGFTATTYYRNAVQVGSDAGDSTGVARATRPLYLYGRNNLGSAELLPANNRLTFVLIGTGFTAGDMANVYSDYQELMNGLRRPVA